MYVAVIWIDLNMKSQFGFTVWNRVDLYTQGSKQFGSNDEGIEWFLAAPGGYAVVYPPAIGTEMDPERPSAPAVWSPRYLMLSTEYPDLDVGSVPPHANGSSHLAMFKQKVAPANNTVSVLDLQSTLAWGIDSGNVTKVSSSSIESITSLVDTVAPFNLPVDLVSNIKAHNSWRIYYGDPPSWQNMEPTMWMNTQMQALSTPALQAPGTTQKFALCVTQMLALELPYDDWSMQLMVNVNATITPVFANCTSSGTAMVAPPGIPSWRSPSKTAVPSFISAVSDPSKLRCYNPGNGCKRESGPGDNPYWFETSSECNATALSSSDRTVLYVCGQSPYEGINGAVKVIAGIQANEGAISPDALACWKYLGGSACTWQAGSPGTDSSAGVNNTECMAFARRYTCGASPGSYNMISPSSSGTFVGASAPDTALCYAKRSDAVFDPRSKGDASVVQPCTWVAGADGVGGEGTTSSGSKLKGRFASFAACAQEIPVERCGTRPNTYTAGDVVNLGIAAPPGTAACWAVQHVGNAAARCQWKRGDAGVSSTAFQNEDDCELARAATSHMLAAKQQASVEQRYALLAWICVIIVGIVFIPLAAVTLSRLFRSAPRSTANEGSKRGVVPTVKLGSSPTTSAASGAAASTASTLSTIA
jgi:hypothetical protein